MVDRTGALMVGRRVDLVAQLVDLAAQLVDRREALLEGQMVDPQVVLVVKEGLSVSQGEVSAAQMVDPQVVLVVHLADLVARLVALKVAWEGRWVAKEVLQVAQREELGGQQVAMAGELMLSLGPLLMLQAQLEIPLLMMNLGCVLVPGLRF
jgi:hypothetical protein